MNNPILFFTATILEWKPLLFPDHRKEIITSSMKFLVENHRVWIYGFVVMPNHMHMLWRMRNHHKQEDVQRDFLKFTAQQLKFDLIAHEPERLEDFRSHAKDRQYQFWERRPYKAIMYNRPVIEQKLGYMHNNPLSKRWNLVQLPEHYRFSSARFYLLEKDEWGFITHYMEHI